MPLYEVAGWGRETNRRRKRRYEAASEDEAIMLAGDDGTIVESIEVVGHPELERAKASAEYLRDRVLSDLGSFGVRSSHYDAVAAQLRERFGFEPKAADVAWGLYNATLKRQTQYDSMASIHRYMAGFLIDEGRDPSPCIQHWAQMQIASWREMGGVVGVRVEAAPNCCANCKAQDGRVFAIADAIKNPPVPCKSCTGSRDPYDKYPWCRCSIAAVLEDT